MMRSMKKQTGAILAMPLLASALLVNPAMVGGRAAPADATLTRARQAVNKGLAYLRRTQEKDGSWSEYPAITALAVAGFLRNGRTEVNDPSVARGVQFLLRAAKKNGAI